MFSPIANSSEWEIVEKKIDKWVYEKDSSITMPTGTHLKFKNGQKLSTNVIRIKIISVIYSNESIPFLLFSGRDCIECDANTALYIHSPSAGFLDGKAGKNSYSYPGNLFYYVDNSLIKQSRMFYGNCLEKKKTTVVWYTKYLGTDKKWHKSVYYVVFNGNKTDKGSKVYKYSDIANTEALVAKDICTELEGIDASSEP